MSLKGSSLMTSLYHLPPLQLILILPAATPTDLLTFTPTAHWHPPLFILEPSPPKALSHMELLYTYRLSFCISCNGIFTVFVRTRMLIDIVIIQDCA